MNWWAVTTGFLVGFIGGVLVAAKAQNSIDEEERSKKL